CCTFYVYTNVVSYVLSTRFIFQEEDGIRDFHVTGVQTCALPISSTSSRGISPPYVSGFQIFNGNNAASSTRHATSAVQSFDFEPSKPSVIRSPFSSGRRFGS